MRIGLAELRCPAEIDERILDHSSAAVASQTQNTYDHHPYLEEMQKWLLIWEISILSRVKTPKTGEKISLKEQKRNEKERAHSQPTDEEIAEMEFHEDPEFE